MRKTSLLTPATLGLMVALLTHLQFAFSGDVEVRVAEQARAVINKRCVTCHSQSQARGGLDMTSLEGVLAGSNSGTVVEPGKPEDSLVYTLAAHTDAPKMPPNAPRIPQRELNAIAAWIESLGNQKLPQGDSKSLASMPRKDANVGSPKDLARDNFPLAQGIVEIKPLSGAMAITAVASSGALVAVSGHRQVLLLDSQTQQWRGALNFPEGDVFVLRFSRDGSKLIAAGGVGGSQGVVVCWETKSFLRSSVIKIEDDVVLALDIAPDERTIAVGGPKRIVEVIDLATSQRKHVLRKHADWITRVAFSNDGVFLASGDRFGSAILWDVHGGQPFDTTDNHAGAITSLQFGHDSNQLWTAGKDGSVHCWDLRHAKTEQRWQVSGRAIANMFVVEDRIVTIDEEKRISTYDLVGGLLSQATIPAEPTCSAMTSGTSPQIIVGDFQAGLHWAELFTPGSSESKVRSKRLPIESLVVNAATTHPKPVERRLMKETSMSDVRTNAESDSSKESTTVARSLLQARRSLETSRDALEKTRQSLAELERNIVELERLIQQLEKR